MRLISQNGNVDIPYDKAILLHAQDYVMARVGDKEYLMGEYSSMEKSYRVMVMLRDCYLGKDCGYHTEHGVCYHSRNDFETKSFKFPDDSEVEV